MLRTTSVITATAACVCLSSPARAGYQDQKDNRNIGVIKRAMAHARKNPALFDGQRIPAGAKLADVGKYINRLNATLRLVVKHYRQLSAKGRARPEVRRLAHRHAALLTYLRAAVPIYNRAVRAAANARTAAVAANKVAMSTARAACIRFTKDVQEAKYRAPMHYMINLMVGGHGTLASVKSINAHKAALDYVASVCGRPVYKTIGAQCGMLYRPYQQRLRKYEMAKWCRAAAMRTKLLGKAVLNEVRFQTKLRAGEVRPERVKHKDGWIAMEGPVSYKTHLFFTAAAKAKLRSEFKALFDAAGVTSLDDPELFRLQTQTLAKLRAVVDALAPSFKTPGTRCRGYACSYARRTIKRWHPRASIKKITLKRQSFRIYRNGLGIPTHRSKGGYILFRLPGARWCQLRSFTDTETYRGHGRFQRATKVRMGYVRFQRCR